jgi:hypothetical protein
VPRDASSSQRSDAGEVAGCHRAPGEGRAGLRLLHLALGIEKIHRGEGRTPWRPRITNELDPRASRGSATGPSQSATSQVPTSAAVPDENPPPADARRSVRDNRTRPIPCGSPHRPPERPPHESPIGQHYSAGWHRPSRRADRDTRIGGTARAAVLTVAVHAHCRSSAPSSPCAAARQGPAQVLSLGIAATYGEKAPHHGILCCLDDTTDPRGTKPSVVRYWANLVTGYLGAAWPRRRG